MLAIQMLAPVAYLALVYRGYPTRLWQTAVEKYRTSRSGDSGGLTQLLRNLR